MNLKIGDNIKRLEFESEAVILPDNAMCVRIDGHKFSKFTKSLNKPFDNVFSVAMIETTKDLLKEYQCSIGYTQSDEITLVIPAVKSRTDDRSYTHILGGRTQKLVSLIASFCTIRFNFHLREQAKFQGAEDRFKGKLDIAYFDARVFYLPDEYIEEAVLFRKIDCMRNSKQAFASTYCSHKELMNKKSIEQVEYCKEKTGNDFDLVPDKYKYGVYIKKEQYIKFTEGASCTRTRIIEEPLSCMVTKELILTKYVDLS